MLWFGSNTETGIAVTYEDGDNTLDFALAAAQTTVTSLLATDIKIGEDDQTKVDFETADEIHFYAGNAQRFNIDANSKISLSNNDSGTSNTIFGKSAGASLDAGSNYNVFIGENVSDAAMNDAVENTAVGYSALSSLTTGDENTMIGRLAGSVIGSGSGNVMIGSAAGYQAEEDVAQCVIIGRGAFNGVATDAANGTVAIGYGAGAAVTSGEHNTAVGFETLKLMQSGDNNTAIGYKALENNNEDAINRNTAVGCNAAINLTTAIKTVAIGDDAIGSGVCTGDSNVAVGQGAGYGYNQWTSRIL